VPQQHFNAPSFHSTQRTERTQRNGRYGRKATAVNDATVATTDDSMTGGASDRHFDTRSFFLNIKLLGVCFSTNKVLIAIYFGSFTLFAADD